MAQLAEIGHAEDAILFGAYRLVPSERALFNETGQVRLSGRAFDLLLALVERPGEVVSKEDLIARVWPQTCVEEGNLRVHIGALRKVLGDLRGGHYVENVVGRGYSFVAPVRRIAPPAGRMASPVAVTSMPPAAHAPAPHADGEPQPLPLLHTRIVGRDDVRRHLAAQVTERRLITIVGPGGMGKTTLALAVAEEVSARFGHCIRFVDLAPLSDPALVASALAVALGLPALGGNALPGLIAHLQDKAMLLVLDNCEHLIDAAVALTERLLHETTQVTILATSREPLRAESEWVHRLQPLLVPPAPGPDGCLRPSLMELAHYPAIQLFVERATAGMDSFSLNQGNADAVADICRRLDGIPLAIELAAGRAEFFGVKGLAARLEDCFAVLTRGRRTALPRHQTLRATLDWSYDMLAPTDQAMLRRFAIFRSGFSLECATEVAHDAAFGDGAVLDSIANLAAKSLVSADTSGDVVQYRLLGTTRAYALEKLRASGEERTVAQRYAASCCNGLTNAQAEWELLTRDAWLARYGRCIDHVRAALDWAFGDDGDLAMALALSAVSAPIWYQLSLMDEYRGRLELALARGAQAGLLTPRLEMELSLALGHTLLHAGGHEGAPAAVRCAVFARALLLARQLDDGPGAMRALWGCYTDAVFTGDYRRGFEFAASFGAAAEASCSEMAKVAHARLMARAHHYLGQHQAAQRHFAFVARHPLGQLRRAQHGFQFDQRVASTAVQARMLWIGGCPDQALIMARQSVNEALEVGHGLTLCFALLLACTVSCWSGDAEATQRYNALLLEQAQRCVLPQWIFWGQSVRAAQLLGGGPRGAAAEASEVLAALRDSPYCGDMQVDVMATLHPQLLMPRAIERAEDGSAGWCCAETLRAWGEAQLRAGADEHAEQLFERARRMAAGQGALGWELRAATSLSKLLRRQGRGAEARPLLLAAYTRFDEGLDTADLRAARRELGGFSPWAMAAQDGR